MSELDRHGNLFGAVAVAVADLTVDRAGSPVGGSLSDAAALSAMYHFLDRPSVDQLRRVLGLTHSGAVRLVDRLAADGLVERSGGPDGRTRSVVLTRKGRAAAHRVAAARAELLVGLLDGLSASERRTLHELIGKVAANLVDVKDGGAWVCRLCDTRACGRDEGRCAVANAAAVKYA